MRASWHALWGCARGPVRRLAPQIRLLAGAATFAACMSAPTAGVTGPLFIAAVTVAWAAACGPPLRVVRAALLLGLALLLPYFLLVPILPAAAVAPATDLRAALAAPWGILVHGLAGILVTTSTAACVTASDLREGLVRLPIPRVVVAILLQIVHQTGTLFGETTRVGEAMAIRGASGRVGTAWRLVASLPRAWLPRVILRAERVAAAMELRGYCDARLQALRPAQVRLTDLAVLVVAAGALGVAVAIRLRGVA